MPEKRRGIKEHPGSLSASTWLRLPFSFERTVSPISHCLNSTGHTLPLACAGCLARGWLSQKGYSSPDIYPKSWWGGREALLTAASAEGFVLCAVCLSAGLVVCPSAQPGCCFSPLEHPHFWPGCFAGPSASPWLAGVEPSEAGSLGACHCRSVNQFVLCSKALA